jgi:hypothetical protein
VACSGSIRRRRWCWRSSSSISTVGTKAAVAMRRFTMLL